MVLFFWLLLVLLPHLNKKLLEMYEEPNKAGQYH